MQINLRQKVKITNVFSDWAVVDYDLLMALLRLRTANYLQLDEHKSQRVHRNIH